MTFYLAYALYLLFAFGVSFVLGFSGLSQPARDALFLSKKPWPKLLCQLVECPGCLGFWIGLAAGGSGFLPEVIAGAPRLVSALYLGFITAGANMILASGAGLFSGDKRHA